MSESSLAAPCALFVHGAGGGAWEWNVWTRVFTARGWRTHAIELEPVEGGYAATRLSDYRMQVEAAVRASSPSVLVGASLGGWLAYAVADAVSALVLVNPLPPSPWHHALRRAEPYPDVVCWRDARRLDGTLAAMPDSDAAARLYAFRSWRNESGAVLNEARAGVQLDEPSCPVLIIAAEDDEDLACSGLREMAQALNASFLNVGGGHLSPLLGRAAADRAVLAVDWLNAQKGFTTH